MNTPEMKNTYTSPMQMTSFTSPDTNKVYTIIESQSERGAWDNQGNYAPVAVTQYSIYDNTQMVQFAFDVNEIAKSVKHYEGFSDGWTSSRFD
jgi:hypothetical protein